MSPLARSAARAVLLALACLCTSGPTAVAAADPLRPSIGEAQLTTFAMDGPRGPAPTRAGRGARASCPFADAPPSASRARLRRALLCLVNAERRRAGVAPVRQHARLRRTAVVHAADMVRRRYFRHDSLDGRSFLDRIVARRYAPRWAGFFAGENLGWGAGRAGTPAGMVRAWMGSPPHRQVVLMPEFRDVGIGIRRGAPVRTAEPAVMYVTNYAVTGMRRRR